MHSCSDIDIVKGKIVSNGGNPTYFSTGSKTVP